MEAAVSFMISFILFISISISISVSDKTLSLEMIRADSLHPCPNTPPSALLEQRLVHDRRRLRALSNPSTQSGSGHLSRNDTGGYLVLMGLGTPPQSLYMMIDTGTDLSRVHCSTCPTCSAPQPPGLLFNLTDSSTHYPVSCQDPICRIIMGGCGPDGDTCHYTQSYTDGNSSDGQVLKETMWIGDLDTHTPIISANITVGCTYDDKGPLYGYAGPLGLNQGVTSFTMQTANLYGKKFSYCLNDESSSSSIVFGSSALSEQAKYTPLVDVQNFPTKSYYVNMTGISVGSQRVVGVNSTVLEMDGSGRGGVIVDSSTMLTWLRNSAYVALREAYVGSSNWTGNATRMSPFDTCFENIPANQNVMVPATVTLHFEGDVDMVLGPENYLMSMGDGNFTCFGFVASNEKLSVIGNVQQQGFRVSVDVDGQRIGFTPNAC